MPKTTTPTLRRMVHAALYCVLVAAGPSGCGAHPRTGLPTVRGGEPGIPDTSWPEVYFERFDGVAGAAGLEPLRSAVPRPGTREARIWIGGGPGYPQGLYRFVDRGGSVTGELVLHWPVGPPDTARGERPGETFHDLMLYNQRGRCDGFARAGETGICRALFARAPDWGRVLRRAEAEGLWTLPDESALPDDGTLTLDGWSVTVELRDGRTYRAYQYDNPRADSPRPEARRALRIAEAMSAVDSLQRPSDVTRVYRGVTPGVYRSEFRACGGTESWRFEEELKSLAQRQGVAMPEMRADSTSRYYVEVLAQPTPEWLARQWDAKYPRVLQVFELRAVRLWTGAECGTGGRD
jgi:hypothetical protein